MYRVELKVVEELHYGSPSTTICVPNVPCGVES